MKTQTSKIKANGQDEAVSINVQLSTKRILTPDELRGERNALNNLLCEALRKYGLNFQDIKVS